MSSAPICAVRAQGTAGPDCLDHVHAVLADLWAGAPEVDEEDRVLFEMAVVEVAGNIVEHAGPKPVTFELDLAVYDGHLEATFRDTGEPTGDLRVDARQMPDEMAETGRGLPMVRAVVDVLEQGRADCTNRWFLRRARAR